jgi:hypothetical protein
MLMAVIAGAGVGGVLFATCVLAFCCMLCCSARSGGGSRNGEMEMQSSTTMNDNGFSGIGGRNRGRGPTGGGSLRI